MFRGRTAKLLRLVRQGSSQSVTTANLLSFTNRVPCDEATFLLADRATVHVLRQMEEYPCNDLTHVQPQPTAPASKEPIFESAGMEQLYHSAMGFSVDLNYLKVEEARNWLRRLNQHEISSNVEALRQIREWISATLLEESMDDYVKEEAERLVEEIGAVERNQLVS